jgi:L-ascorbate metabolism protein UlaG (beta-lactamase superfamily)
LWAYRNVKVHWLGHDSFVLQGSRTVVIDPFKAKGDYKADVLFISHEHYDHLSEDDIRRFSDQSTTIVAPRICEGQLRGFKSEKLFVEAGSTTEAKGIAIEAIPAYNIDKFRSPGRVFHPREDGRVGYIITLDGVRFYHAGDSDATSEMKAVDADVAFLPVSGTFVMTAEEAAGAAKAMNIKVAVPMHYGAGVVGTLRDSERFRDLLTGKKEVVILEKEG